MATIHSAFVHGVVIIQKDYINFVCVKVYKEANEQTNERKKICCRQLLNKAFYCHKPWFIIFFFGLIYTIWKKISSMNTS